MTGWTLAATRCAVAMGFAVGQVPGRGAPLLPAHAGAATGAWTTPYLADAIAAAGDDDEDGPENLIAPLSQIRLGRSCRHSPCGSVCRIRRAPCASTFFAQPPRC